MLVIQIEVIDVAGGVVAIHNVPVKGDVGAALGGPEVANVLVLGICRNARKGYRVLRLPPNYASSYVASYVRVSDPESSIAKIRIAIFRKLASSAQKGR